MGTRSSQTNSSALAWRRLKALCLSATFIGFTACARNDANNKAWLEYIEIANEKVKVGDYLAAEDLYLKAKEECQTNFGDNDARTGTCLGYLAELYLGEQEYVKAAVAYKSLIAIERKCAPNSAELERDVKEYEFIQEKLKEYGLQESNDKTGKHLSKTATHQSETGSGTPKEAPRSTGLSSNKRQK